MDDYDGNMVVARSPHHNRAAVIGIKFQSTHATTGPDRCPMVAMEFLRADQKTMRCRVTLAAAERLLRSLTATVEALRARNEP